MSSEDKLMIWFSSILVGGFVIALIVTAITSDRVPERSILIQRLIDSRQGEWRDKGYCKEFVLKPFNVEKQ